MADFKEKFLTFEVSGQIYAIPIAEITEILSNCSSFVRVPEFPYYSPGIVHLRGSVVSIIDLRRRFGVPDSTEKERCVIITRLDDEEKSLVGYAADKVIAVEDMEVGDIQNMPVIITGADYVSGIIKKDNRIILILDPVLLVGAPMRAAIGTYKTRQEN